MMLLRTICLVLLFATVLQAGQGEHGGYTFHGKSSSIPKLNYDSLFEAATPLSESSAGKEMVENCLLAYGGVESLKKLDQFRIKFQMVAPMGAADTMTIEKNFSRDHRYRIIRKSNSEYEARNMVDSKASVSRGDSVVAVNDIRYRSEMFSYLTLAMPLAIQNEPFTEIRFGKREGDSLNYLYLLKKDTLMLVLGINPESYMMEKYEGIIYGTSSRIVFMNQLSDFRTVDGYTFPHSVVFISLWMEVGRAFVTDIELNPNFSPDDFRLSTPEKSNTGDI